MNINHKISFQTAAVLLIGQYTRIYGISVQNSDQKLLHNSGLDIGVLF